MQFFFTTIVFILSAVFYYRYLRERHVLIFCVSFVVVFHLILINVTALFLFIKNSFC
jgi:hypothetical protein